MSKKKTTKRGRAVGPFDSPAEKKAYLEYCEHIVAGAATLQSVHVALIRACRNLPTLQALTLPGLLGESVGLDIENHQRRGCQVIEELNDAIGPILQQLPALTSAVQMAKYRLWGLASGEAHSEAPGVRAFVRGCTKLGELSDSDTELWGECYDAGSL